MYTISYINFWNNNNDIQDRWITKFIEKNLNIQIKEVNPNNSIPDIIICSCMWPRNIELMNRFKNCKLKIFFYGENPDTYKNYFDFEKFKKYFDLIIGFKYTDKKNKIYRLPVWMICYPYYNMNDNENNILTHIQKNYTKNNLIPKSNCALIARHDNGGQRTILYNYFSKYSRVICPSTFKNNAPPIGKLFHDKHLFLKKFLFNICPENSGYHGYFTEKIFHALEAGCIPIYWASETPEPGILNEDCYYLADLTDGKKLDREIRDVLTMPEKYKPDKLFTSAAPEIIKKYYNDIIFEMKQILNIKLN